MLFRIAATLLVAFLPFISPLEAGFWTDVKEYFGFREKYKPPQIKVLIAHDQDAVNLEVKGKYSLYDPKTKEHISTRFIGKNKLMQGLRGGLKWGEEFPGLYQIKIVPEEPITRILINGGEYSGSVYVYDIGGGISIVNEIDIEQYLKSLMSSLFKEPAPPEALAAFAIAARTNAYYQASNPRNTYWSVDGQKVGYEGEQVIGFTRSSIEAAVATQYMILSRTGIYERTVLPFPLQWGPIVPGKTTEEQPAVSEISMEEAYELAQKGMHAAQILSRAFPGAMIMLMGSN